MHELYELKEMLMDELKEYGSKGDMTAGSLDVVDKLAHAVKSICKIIEYCEEEEYSMRGGSYEGGNSYARNGRSGRSYARNGRSYARGRYSRRGYSMDGDIVEELRDLMDEVPEDKKKDFERFIKKLEM